MDQKEVNDLLERHPRYQFSEDAKELTELHAAVAKLEAENERLISVAVGAEARSEKDRGALVDAQAENAALRSRLTAPAATEAEAVQIRFDGPPSHESGRFVEVENEKGESINFGEWFQDGEYWLLKFLLSPRPTVSLEAENATLRERVKRLEAVITEVLETPINEVAWTWLDYTGLYRKLRAALAPAAEPSARSASGETFPGTPPDKAKEYGKEL